MALISASVMYCKLLWTTSAIGPNTAPRCDTPVFSRSLMSLMSQSPRPASLFDVNDGAYQFCNGIRPPPKAAELTGPPIALIDVWPHAAVSQAFDQIRAAVPFHRLGRIRLVLAFAEEQRTPADQQVAVVEREAQFVRTAGFIDRRNRAHVREDGVRVGACHLRVGRERMAGYNRLPSFERPLCSER